MRKHCRENRQKRVTSGLKRFLLVRAAARGHDSCESAPLAPLGEWGPGVRGADSTPRGVFLLLHLLLITGWMILQLGCGLSLAHGRMPQQTEQDKGITQSSPASNGNGNLPKQEVESQATEEFIIGPGDVLNVFVWKEPEVSRSVPVRPDGKISLPLVNDVQAMGLTAVQLKEMITDKLKGFIAEPTVTVTVEKVNSQKVTIMGEVNSPGAQPLTGPTRIMDILATSRFTTFAKTTRIYVLRDENGKQQRLDFNYKDYVKGKNPNQNFLLKNGDTIIVP